MAKNKIGIVLKANHLNLIASFKNHLEAERKYDNYLYDKYYGYGLYDDYDDYCGTSYYKKCYPSEDDYYNDMERYYNEVYGDDYGSKKKSKKYNDYDDEDYKGKKHKHYKKSKARKDDKYYLKDDDSFNNKLIYYYRDYLNPEDVEMFENLFDFDAYIANEGITIPDNEVNNILTRGVSHCCINPKARLESGRLDLISKSSYSDLRYACSECEDSVVEPNTAYAG